MRIVQFHRISLLFILLFSLISCRESTLNNNPQLTAQPPISKETFTPAPVLSSKSPTYTPKPTWTPIPTSKPYLIKLTHGAGDGVDEMYICMGVFAPFPKFILYEDGELVFHYNGKLQKSKLTDLEISNLLNKINATGFFEIGDRFEDQYDLPDNIQYGEGGWGESISVAGKDAYVHPELVKYVKKPITDTIGIIRNYLPQKAENYIPKKIELWAIPVEIDFFFSTPSPSSKVTTWPNEFPSLKGSYLILSESETRQLIELNLFDGVPQLGLFNQDGKDYHVLACPPWYEWQ